MLEAAYSVARITVDSLTSPERLTCARPNPPGCTAPPSRDAIDKLTAALKDRTKSIHNLTIAQRALRPAEAVNYYLNQLNIPMDNYRAPLAQSLLCVESLTHTRWRHAATRH